MKPWIFGEKGRYLTQYYDKILNAKRNIPYKERAI